MAESNGHVRTPSSSAPHTSFILTLACSDHPGIVAKVSGLLASHNLNIEDSAQFWDRDANSNKFFMRVQFEIRHGSNLTGLQDIRAAFEKLMPEFGQDAVWDLHPTLEKPRVLLMVSKIGHCLNDILFKQSNNQLPIEVPLIVSNHPDFQSLAITYNIPFYYIPVTKETKTDAEAKVLKLIKEYKCDLVVMARYMQVLTANFCDTAPPIINIHHSTLPSFAGAKPYFQAFDRGVKLIGATAHFATSGLDEGPIIEQDFSRVTHAQSPKDLTNVGSNIECLVLARAIKHWAERRVFINGNKTIVF